MPGFKPSQRRHKVDSDVELTLIPVMSLLVVLVPMLLQTAVFEQIAAVDLPLASSDEAQVMEQTPPDEAKESVSLAVTDEGFQIVSGEKTLTKIPLTDKGFDFDKLKEELKAVKGRKRFSHQEAIILLVEDVVRYQDIIHTMDACRPYYPGISLSDRIVEDGEGG